MTEPMGLVTYWTDRLYETAEALANGYPHLVLQGKAIYLAEDVARWLESYPVTSAYERVFKERLLATLGGTP